MCPSETVTPKTTGDVPKEHFYIRVYEKQAEKYIFLTCNLFRLQILLEVYSPYDHHSNVLSITIVQQVSGKILIVIWSQIIALHLFSFKLEISLKLVVLQANYSNL